MMPDFCSLPYSCADSYKVPLTEFTGAKWVWWLCHLLLLMHFYGVARENTKAWQLNDFKMYQNLHAYTVCRLQLPTRNFCLVLQHPAITNDLLKQLVFAVYLNHIQNKFLARRNTETKLSLNSVYWLQLPKSYSSSLPLKFLQLQGIFNTLLYIMQFI